jgi:hypothetical protein
MFEENQSEITKALLGLIVCSLFALVGADLSARIMTESNGYQALLPGIIAGMLTGALSVELFMNKFISD